MGDERNSKGFGKRERIYLEREAERGGRRTSEGEEGEQRENRVSFQKWEKSGKRYGEGLHVR